MNKEEVRDCKVLKLDKTITVFNEYRMGSSSGKERNQEGKTTMERGGEKEEERETARVTTKKTPEVGEGGGSRLEGRGRG